MCPPTNNDSAIMSSLKHNDIGSIKFQLVLLFYSCFLCAQSSLTYLYFWILLFIRIFVSGVIYMHTRKHTSYFYVFLPKTDETVVFFTHTFVIYHYINLFHLKGLMTVNLWFKNKMFILFTWVLLMPLELLEILVQFFWIGRVIKGTKILAEIQRM